MNGDVGGPGAGLSPETIASAVAQAGLEPLAAGLPEKFSQFHELLQRWNTKLNLTAIRNPEEALRRHFVECIFCAQHLPAGVATLMDFGSGAGFPGIPIALCRPEIWVTLAEAQGKKASFLREAVRVLDIRGEVYGERVEEMRAGRRFDVVSLRAVDQMGEALGEAGRRVKEAGWLAVLATSGGVELPGGFSGEEMAIPGSRSRVLILGSRTTVPRGTVA